MSKYELSLASNYVADWTIIDAIREYFQNAIDQSITVADNPWYYHYDNKTGILDICNKRSVLTAKTLLLGGTTKADDEQTIGKYGEGYKIATLVALREGKKVTFYNYGAKEVWYPRMVKSRRYDAEILTFFTEKHTFKKVPNNDLTIRIEGITSEEWEKIVASNLHMTKDIGEIISVEEGRILKAPRYKGKIFVSGLFVRNEKDLEYGYDILPKYLKLDRDRKMVSSFDLQWFTAKMWSNVNSPEVVEIAKKGAKDIQYMGVQSYVILDTKVTGKAYETFQEEYGNKAIPVTSQVELESVQASYQDAKPVLVSETFKRMITEADDYVVKAMPRQVITQEERLLMWYAKIESKITQEEGDEFLDIIGKTREEINPF